MPSTAVSSNNLVRCVYENIIGVSFWTPIFLFDWCIFAVVVWIIMICFGGVYWSSLMG